MCAREWTPYQQINFQYVLKAIIALLEPQLLISLMLELQIMYKLAPMDSGAQSDPSKVIPILEFLKALKCVKMELSVDKH